LKQQLKKVYQKSPSARIHAAIEELHPKHMTRTPVPNFHDRQAAATIAVFNKLPVFYQKKQIGSKCIVPCYVDVSGSQYHVIDAVQKVVSRLKRVIGEVVRCFSTSVNPSRVSSFCSGQFISTGGTDFNPVALDILKNKFRAVVILTDGQAHLNEDLISQIKSHGVKVTVGWTVDNPDYYPLIHIATKTFFVFNDGEET